MVSRTEQAMEHRCPECDAAPGSPCLYLPVPEPTYHLSHVQRDRHAARAALTGTPTKRPHTRRFSAVAEHDRKIRRALPPVPPPDPVATALRQFDAAESLELRDWLARHGRLLMLLPRHKNW